MNLSNDEDEAPLSSGTSNGEERLDIIYEAQYQDLQARDERLQPRARFLADWTKVVVAETLVGRHFDPGGCRDGHEVIAKRRSAPGKVRRGLKFRIVRCRRRSA